MTAIVHSYGPPNLFFTLSVADKHWTELMQHLPRYQEWLEGDKAKKSSIANENLRDYLHVVDNFFWYRVEAFLDKVTKPKFNAKDWWYRYEWQGRGSAHVHDFLWIDGLPPWDLKTDTGKEEFAEFCGKHATTLNPDPKRPTAPVDEDSALQLFGHEKVNNQQQQSDVVNRVLHHTHQEYCLRRKKGAPEAALHWCVVLISRTRNTRKRK